MMYNLSNILLIILFSLQHIFYTAQSSDPSYYSCNNDTKNSTTQTSRNIDTLLPALVKGTIQNGFVATSYGQQTSKIYGLAQCRGDVSEQDCSTCIQDAAKDIRDLCPTQSDARIWYDYCFLRYSTVNFFGQVDTSGIYFYNVENVSDSNVFNQKLGALMNDIRSQAVKPGQKGLGKGKTEISNFDTLYALVQCTRDLSDVNCAQCLAIGISNFPRFCDNKRGCRVVYSSCYIRYELYPFYFPLDSLASLVQRSEKYGSFMAYRP